MMTKCNHALDTVRTVLYKRPTASNHAHLSIVRSAAPGPQAEIERALSEFDLSATEVNDKGRQKRSRYRRAA
jgi:hypothetical protein